MNNNKRGFTLVELIIVIVILGILAAYVVSKFSELDTEARRAVMKQLAGSIKSTSAIVHGKAVASHRTREEFTTLQVEDRTVYISYGYAVASEDGILKALDEASIARTSADRGDVITVSDMHNSIIFQHRAARKAAEHCFVRYCYNNDGKAPEIEMVLDDCK